MKTKKQIDRLFREQFKDFDATPPPEAWENIKARLQEKKKERKVIPLFWLRATGVAALFALFFSVGNHFFNFNENNHITVEEDSFKKEHPDNNNLLENHLQNNTDKTFVSNENEIINTSEGKNNNEKKNNTISNKQAVKKSIANNPIKKDKSEVETNNSKTYNAIANSQKENQTKGKNSSAVENSTSNKKEAIAVVKNQNETNKLENKETIKNIKQSEKSIEEVGIAKTEEESVKESNKKSLIEYLKEKEVEEELLANTDNSFDERWAVSPNFAPLYYNTFGDGSSIDTQFSNNSKSGDVNYGYGVQVSYAINDKLSVRTGLNKVDLSYVTNNIEFVGAGIDQGLSSINYGNSSNIILVGTVGSLNTDSEFPIVDGNGTVIIPRNGNAIPGSMTQSIDYFEIPLELKYGLVNKRFGVNLIGGMSTLLLNNNEISVQSSGFKTIIGEANNLNDLSFSTNVGIGLDYKISKRFIFNIEPMFKYQLNPYSDSNVNFKPYYLGVYSGFSYKF